MKEFLAARAVAFDSINVVEAVDGFERLRAEGLRGVPVVAVVDAAGRRFVYGQDLGQVADLVGEEYAAAPALEPAELINRYGLILGAVVRYTAAIPPRRLTDELPGRPRSYLSLANHAVEIAAGYLAAASGEAFDGALATAEVSPPRPPQELIDRAAALSDELPSTLTADFTQLVSTYYGPQTLHAVLERCTWHSAQHLRQLQWALQRLQLEPEGPLDESVFDGLPMPEDAWDPA